MSSLTETGTTPGALSLADSKDLEQEEKQSHHQEQEQNNLLQAELARFFQKKSLIAAPQDEAVMKWKYEKNLNLLRELRQQQTEEIQRINQLSVENELKLQKQLDEVEREWRSFMKQKQRVAVQVLSRRMGKDAAQAKVTLALKAEEEFEERLNTQCRKNIRLQLGTETLEEKLHNEEKLYGHLIKNQKEKMRGDRLQQKKLDEQRKEKSSKLQKQITRSIDILSNMKEKLKWTHEEVQLKQSHLTQLELAMAKKKHLLTETKQACFRLNEDNITLKERRRRQGNMLLQDYQNIVDDCKRMEEKLENLKRQWAELNVDGVGDNQRP
ncbi:cilia- and flagella-associated protein 184-like [Synchiropus picturatus]